MMFNALLAGFGSYSKALQGLN
ncbi:protein of unknown function [Kyrpidia spormannii]|uniref:Uncharacterized protein n=2 Tax=Kyrpidia spormannii TaxID=2055160 RepID=A0ACA8Z498_9BACL|nr:protein of unknown function [Kyrpidia spormannii]CAB3389660.1 protein of unknown function [Kyrpidia spormannii]